MSDLKVPLWYDPARKFVVCIDGPRGGQWHYLDTWQELRRIAIEANHETPHTGRTLGYVPVRDSTERHREHPDIRGHQLAWSPDTAAAAMTRLQGATT